jgi:HD superfamily phosphodiesterase
MIQIEQQIFGFEKEKNGMSFTVPADGLNGTICKVTDAMIARIAEVMDGVDPAHNMDHVRLVVFNARNICSAGQLDADTTDMAILAAWLHDLGRAYKAGSDKSHAELSVQYRKKALQYNTDFHRDVVIAVAEHSNPEPASTLTGQILQDADKLAGLGEIGLWRAIVSKTNLSTERVLAVMKSCEFLPEEHDQLVALLGQLKFQEEWFRMLNTESAQDFGLQNYIITAGYNKILYGIMYGQ